MAHKTNNGENTINKTFIFKAKCDNNDIISLWKPAMEEYCTYYNKLSQWICNNLTSMKVKDLFAYLDDKQKTKPCVDKKTGETKIGVGYYRYFIENNKEDMPLYWLFTKNCSSSHADNLLFEFVRKVNHEEYNGNSLGMGETDYRRFGYFQNVISNFRTKMSSLKATTKWKKFDVNDVDEDTLKNQTIYDVDKYGIESVNDFNERIDILKIREETEQTKDKIARLECLCKYYKEHEEDIKNEIATMAIADLQKFGGCQRKSMNTLTIHKQDSPMEKVGNTSFNLRLTFNKKPYTLNLLGNRQVVKFVGGKRIDLINITENHGDWITFNIKNNELFVHMTSPVDFEKEVCEIKNAVGVDVNIKHMMLATSIVDDGNVKGYINLYRELVNNNDFIATFGNSKNGHQGLEIYEQMAENVNFGILETESLFERVVNQSNGGELNNQLIRREIAMQKVFDNITKTNNDKNIVNYVNYVKMLRAKYKAYFILKEKYYEKQKEYDDMMGFNDESTENKEMMDKRRFEFSFINTDTAQELLIKLNKVEQDLIGCRDNIVTYAFNVFKTNGYDTLAVEYLDSAQFDKAKMPTPKSLLKYHKFEGKTIDEVKEMMNNKNFTNAYYNFKFENEIVKDIEYSTDGIWRQKKLNFMNLIIKAIHFADIKDKFVQLCNNNSMNVVFCPSAFTSQMDSITHSLYYIEKTSKTKNGKEKKQYVLANKKMVRTQQEKHINGLNADFNSACNLKYIALDEELRNAMTDEFNPKKQKTMYGVPAYNIKNGFKKNLSTKTINTFRTLGHYRDGKINEDGVFVENLA